jgi:flagellar biosynthesis/type III secretory pathway protein FliH
LRNTEEGRKEGRKEGRQAGRQAGSKEGRKAGSKEGRPSFLKKRSKKLLPLRWHQLAARTHERTTRSDGR